MHYLGLQSKGLAMRCSDDAPSRAMEQETPILRAIRAVGGDKAFMRKLGVSRRTFFYLKKGERIDVDRAIAIERFSGVPRHELLPSVFAPPAKSRSRAQA